MLGARITCALVDAGGARAIPTFFGFLPQRLVTWLTGALGSRFTQRGNLITTGGARWH
jgi:hypothetical protein